MLAIAAVGATDGAHADDAADDDDEDCDDAKCPSVF